MPHYLTSVQAAARLGVSRQTLYAYVSRGLLHAAAGETQRESRYLAADVARLADQRTRGRKPKEVAKATLDWGLPVLESGITLIAHQQLFYRGESALGLAATHSLEDLAAHLWQCEQATAFGATVPVRSDTSKAALKSLTKHYSGQRAEDALLPLFAVASDDAGTGLWQTAPERLLEGSGTLVRCLAACLLGTSPATTPIHRQCARAWGLDPRGAELVRMALVLCADHELNASSFTARCVASTGASLRAAVLGGLAALSGGRHGGSTARGEALWDELGDGDVGRKMRARLARGDDLPCFGHPLYPDGDVRAAAILQRLLPHHPQWQEIIDQAFELVGLRPSLDFALVALRRHLALPIGAAFGIFALGRSVGWIAHALEQRTTEHLIRPRAAYTGLHPAPA